MIEVVIFGLATWRISSLLVYESGPWKIFQRLRELAGIQHDISGEPYLIPDTGFFAGLLSCVWCSSMWVAVLWFVFWFLSPDIALKIATAFSFSTVAIMIDNYTSD